MLPHVLINVATTIDGKLAPSSRQFIPFGSRRDHELLLELRAGADAVMSGARTVDTNDVNLGPGAPKYRQLRLQRGLPEYNLRVVVSGTATLDPAAAIFNKRFSPIIVLASSAAPQQRLARLRAVADEVAVFGDQALDFPAALQWLNEKWNVKTLLCEGGGEVNGALFQEDLVDEIYQTVCPFVFGGRAAPTMADGLGVETVAQGRPFKLKSLRQVEDELFLVYKRASAA